MPQIHPHDPKKCRTQKDYAYAYMNGGYIGIQDIRTTGLTIYQGHGFFGLWTAISVTTRNTATGRTTESVLYHTG